MTEAIRHCNRPCPICMTPNQTTAAGRYSRDGWSIVDCVSCGFAHLPVVPVTVELEDNIAWEKSFAQEKVRRKQKQPVVQWLDEKTRWRLHMFPRVEAVEILNKVAPSGPAIDLGCGSGTYLAKFDARFTPYGVEISKALAAQAQASVQARGGKVAQGSCAAALSEFPDWEAREVMTCLARKMAPGGVAIVKVPNYGGLNRRIMGKSWAGFRIPDHVNYFDRQSLEKLATATGFTARFPVLNNLPTDDNMIAILTKV
jgi:SAM-dependent methyltransferase